MSIGEKILVTSALPYANGPIHFGHIAGAYLPADIYVRYQKMTGSDIIYICGSDDHGVAITLSAEKLGRTPEEHVKINRDLIMKIFNQFKIEFDNFSATSKPNHYKISQQFFTELNDNGFIEPKTTKQLFCINCEKFLADRYVYGTCPECGYENARGDECGKCGKWLDPLDIINPKCKVCGKEPESRETTNWYLKLGDLSGKLKDWLDLKPHWKSNVTQFVKSMIDQGLESRPITRDMKWGVPVPLEEAEGKVLYVWFDAPIGYISSTMEWAEGINQPDKWKDYWYDTECKLIHFIGKDNISFHCVVWPAMLMGQKQPFILPENVPANEFYNLEGKQFSKSEGWYIDLDEFFDKYPSDLIRYYIASNLPEKQDSDFSWKDFQLSMNSELADTYGNLVNRALSFAYKHFDGKVPTPGEFNNEEKSINESVKNLVNEMGNSIENFEFRKTAYSLMEIARQGNKFFNDSEPWKSMKTDRERGATSVYTSLNLLKNLAVVSYPIIPDTAQKLWEFLGMEGTVKEAKWPYFVDEFLKPDQLLNKPEILFSKIEDEQIESEIAKLGKLKSSN